MPLEKGQKGQIMKALFNLSEIILTKKNANPSDEKQQKTESLLQEQHDKLQNIMGEHQKRAKVRTLNADEVICLVDGLHVALVLVYNYGHGKLNIL